MQTTFHMAFDAIDPERKFEAIDLLESRGITRILTHGAEMTTRISDNYEHLAEIVSYAGDKIQILIGGGVTSENYEEVVKESGAKQVHGTKIV
jgi:copper homeostasis protein